MMNIAMGVLARSELRIQMAAVYATARAKKIRAVCRRIGESKNPGIFSKAKWVLFRFSNSPYRW